MQSEASYWNKTFRETVKEVAGDKIIISVNEYKISELTRILKDMELNNLDKLEVGCGMCHVASALGWKENYMGVDVSEFALKFAASKGMNVQCGDIMEFEPEKQYDCILFLDSLEHIFGIDYLALKIKSLLKVGGKVIINIPLCQSFHDRDHDYYLFDDSVGRMFFFCDIHGYEKFDIEIPDIKRSYRFFIGEKSEKSITNLTYDMAK